MNVNILIEPIITDKVLRVMGVNNQHAFRVHKAATKKDIAKAIKEIFNVEF